MGITNMGITLTSTFMIIVIGMLGYAIITNIFIVNEKYEYIIERLGKYHKTCKSGLNLKIPIIDKVVNKVQIKEELLDFKPQEVITKDNATMLIDTVVYYQVNNTRYYTYGVDNPKLALYNLNITTLRNIIGDLTVDQTLTSRDEINSKMKIILDDATNSWGIKVNRVEIKGIKLPDDVREAMESELKAERLKRSEILKSEADKQSHILKAEGISRARILEAESKAKASMLEAEANKQVEILNAEAKAKSIELINSAKPSKEMLTLKSFDALIEMGKGSANKIFIPSELQNLTIFSDMIKNK